MAHDSLGFCLSGKGGKSRGKNVRPGAGLIMLLFSDCVGAGENDDLPESVCREPGLEDENAYL